MLASGSNDKSTKLWNIESEIEINTLRNHHSAYSVAFS